MWETQSKFVREQWNRTFVSIAYTNNEAPVYDILGVAGFVSNIGPVEEVETSERKLFLRKASLKDNDDNIPITVFWELLNHLNKQSNLFFTSLRVSKYMASRFPQKHQQLHEQKTSSS